MKLINSIRKSVILIAHTYVQPREYVRLPANGFRHDQLNLRSDVTKIGTDMRKAIVKYGERAY